MLLSALWWLAPKAWWMLGQLWKSFIFVAKKSFRAGWRALQRPSTTHGSARWASEKTIEAGGLFGSDGLIIGKVGDKYLRYSGDGHVLCMAATRTGKGVSFVIPALLNTAGSVFCLDPKDENYQITKRQRETFGPVYKLDPTDPFQSACFNPISIIRPRWHEVDDAEALAALLVADEGRDNDHWREKSKQWLAGLILYVLHHYKDRPVMQTLTEVHNLLCSDKAEWETLLTNMKELHVPYVTNVARQIERGQKSDECANIISNCLKATNPWDASRPLSVICCRNDFDFEDFYLKPQTLFIRVPADQKESYAGFVRVVMGAAMHAMYRAGSQCLPMTERPLFLLDEAASMGRLTVLEDGIADIGAYARVMLVFQSMDQIREVYKKAQSLVVNAGVQIMFGVNDIATAQETSERLGRYTVTSKSEGFSQDAFSVLGHGANAGEAEAGRALLDTAEVMKCSPDEAIVFVPNRVADPMRVTKIKYYSDPLFAGQFDKWRIGDDKESEPIPLQITYAPLRALPAPRPLLPAPEPLIYPQLDDVVPAGVAVPAYSSYVAASTKQHPNKAWRIIRSENRTAAASQLAIHVTALSYPAQETTDPLTVQ